jgi:UDP-N-acetylmuramoyl-L-alanyl-D-glutamate--2,6-diaminopimelate ligase
MVEYNQLEAIFKELEITGLCCDSRKIRPGDAFVAISGESYDGNNFINVAIESGAEVVITDNLTIASGNFNNKIIYVENARIALSVLAGIFHPKLPEYLIAVTGTNGKTSIVAYCRQLYTLLNQRAASIGTIGIECDFIEQKLYSQQNLTTPDPLTFRSALHNLATNNINYVAFEASSHGLDQERLYGIKVNVAAFSSFSQDHLDYHKTMDSYLEAKLKLFKSNLLADSIAVISSEVEQLDYIKDFLAQNNVNFLTIGARGDVLINPIRSSMMGQEVNFTYKGTKYNFSTEIIGGFQSSNLLIAAFLVHKTGFTLEEVVAQLPKVKAVLGRLERVTSNKHSFHIFVDYAHTPDALKNSLNELRKIKSTNGKLKVLFGCGGNRDNSKRGLMGAIASKLADEVIITDDNPRKENPGQIRREILQTAQGAIEIPGRQEAITKVISELQRDDILLIAGKGHENYQIIGDNIIEFNDASIAKKVLENL